MVEALTPAEVSAVEAAALSSTEKFLARLTLAAWRMLIAIAHDRETTVESLTTAEIVDWIEKTPLPWEGDPVDFPDDREDAVTHTSLSSHEKFLCRLIIAGRSVLLTVARSVAVEIADLSLGQIMHWIETEVNTLRSQGKPVAFLVW